MKDKARGEREILSVLLGALLGGASQGAIAQEQPAALEEVVVTGTRIRGAEGAVGIAVSQFDEQDFREAAEVTVSGLFKSAVPSVLVPPSRAPQQGRNWAHNENVNIHNLGGERTLVLVNGARVPLHGWVPDGYDPSVIPAISLQRVDLLTAGASATYGSDAIAGVINLVLRRGFEGARTQLFTGTSDGNRLTRQVSQLFGTTWEGGGVTVGFEFYDDEAFPASETDHLVYDLTPFGIADNLTPINSAIPAIISTGRPSAPVRNWGSSCQDAPPFPAPFNVNPGANCYSVPAGTGWDFGAQAPGATVDWATLLANKNVDNLFNPWQFADYVGDDRRTAFTMTFDQRITDTIEAFADAYYSDRSSGLQMQHHLTPFTGGAFTVPIRNPADYPYTPTGAPPGLMASYSTQAEINGALQAADEEASRVAVGLNIGGPGQWSSRIYYAYNQLDTDMGNTNIVNVNNVNAALGNVVFDGLGQFSPYVIGSDPNRMVTAGDLAGQLASVQARYPVGTPVRVIDPASVPFLNVFCDPRQFQCNDPRTLDFLRAYDDYDSSFEVQELEATLTGPSFPVPGGRVQVAVGASVTDESYSITRNVTYSAISTEFPETYSEEQGRDFWSVFGEMRLPIFSEQNARPGFQNLELQLSARHDDYSDFGSTTNPQIGGDWEPIEGLTIRGSRGRAFRAPNFGNLTGLVGVNLGVWGISAGGRPPNPAFQVCTPQQVAQASQPTPGTFAERVINAVGAVDCSDAAIMAQFAAVAADPNNPLYPSAVTSGDPQTFANSVRLPGLLLLAGGVGELAGRTALHPPGFALQPEESEAWSLGFDYAPPAAEGRLTFGLTFFEHEIENLLTTPAAAFVDIFNNPASNNQFTLRGESGYGELFDFFLRHPLLPTTVNHEGVSTIWDITLINVGLQEVRGIDYNANYEWDLGGFTWNVGVVGTYMVQDERSFGGADGEDIYESSLRGLEGLPTAPRTRLRAQLGVRHNNGFSGILFMNYQSRYYSRTNSPVFGSIPSGRVPSYSTYDLTLAYETGDNTSRDILSDMTVRLSMNNVTDQDPPFFYHTGQRQDVAAVDQTQFSAFGRTVSLSLTKSW